MARGPRTDHEGAWHHVMNRGARRAPIFGVEEHAGTFLCVLGETVSRFDLEVHAYGIMPNHYHLLVRSVRGNLSRAMRHLGAGFTQMLNRTRGWDGPVFRGRFRSQVVGDDSYLLTVAAYIHLNPVRAGIARRLNEHCWTSHRAYLDLDLPPDWLSRDYVRALAGGAAQFADFVAGLRTGREQWPARFDPESGWLRMLPGQQPWTLPAPRVTDRSTPRSVLSLEVALHHVGALTGRSLRELRTPRRGPRGNPPRRFAVWALARATAATHAQIGRALGMSATHVSAQLRRIDSRRAPEISSWMTRWAEWEQMASVES